MESRYTIKNLDSLVLPVISMKPVLHQLNSQSADFPPVSQALQQPNGLLAFGGRLDTPTLITAYRSGIFPWYNQGEPVLWWSPDPRMVIKPDQIHISRSMHKFLKKHHYRISIDKDFAGVMHFCRRLREQAEATWITSEMEVAYNCLHRQGFAHSLEVWDGQELVGGIYGIAMDRMFFGESMFSGKPNTSKLAIIMLCQFLKDQEVQLLDCQVPNPHLESLGGEIMSRSVFLEKLKKYCRTTESIANWNYDRQWTAGQNERS